MQCKGGGKTEIDRIKSEGWLPENFFLEEVICNYKVTEKLKQIWAIELDLFREFLRVCTKYDLRWFAIGGTALGCVRHRGFIPWDDDMDVVMPREDYNRMKELSHEFCHPYFLQSPDTDPEYGYSFLKLRNSNTAWYSKKFIHRKFNQGMFLDIFPLDKGFDEDFAQQRKDILTFVRASSACMKVGSPFLTPADREQIEKYYDSEKSCGEIFANLECVASRHQDEVASYLCLSVFLGCSDEKIKWRASVFDDYIEKDFYGFPLRLPKGWDEMLSVSFGDWHTFPPVEERGVWHRRDINCNPLVPYTVLMEEHAKMYNIDSL